MEFDESLLEQLKGGCPEAYEVLVGLFEGPLYRFFVCSHGDHHLAQDQSAETFAQLVRSMPNMSGGSEQLQGFVFGVARNVQRRRWRKGVPKHASLTAAGDTDDARPSPQREAAGREELQRTLDVIRQLDEPGRTVLVLRFVESLSLDEISHALEMPVGTVKSHIHRGRKRLNEILAEEECGT